MIFFHAPGSARFLSEELKEIFVRIIFIQSVCRNPHDPGAIFIQGIDRIAAETRRIGWLMLIRSYGVCSWINDLNAMICTHPQITLCIASYLVHIVRQKIRNATELIALSVILN